VKIVLISTYELGRQPFGLASPAAWLRERGHDVVCLDLSRQELDRVEVSNAGLIGFYVPMHTATRLTMELAPAIRKINSNATLCAYGLYAPLAKESFRTLGMTHLFGGEFESELAELADRLERGGDVENVGAPTIARLVGAPTKDARADISLERLKFAVPDRGGLPGLKNYAHLVMPDGEHRVTGYTEASRGCKHLCRHCPIVPVYNGVFRVVARDVVMADIRQQVAAGARHITFGDPDFFNGVGHAIPLVTELHREFPGLSYDVTIKVEHLRKHADLLAVLRRTGCLMITSAVESLDEVTLERLQKLHTREDFFAVVRECRRADISLLPTFLPFTPWTTFEQYLDLLEQIERLGLVEAVAPIQLAIRLLLPPGSRLLELEEVRRIAGPFDAEKLVFPWTHEDAEIDVLAECIAEIVADTERKKQGRAETFAEIRRVAEECFGRRADICTVGRRSDERMISTEANRARVKELYGFGNGTAESMLTEVQNVPRATIPPHLNEPWYC
jgi:radical SAM superfamily enzyme YgiQ (UPF0313 family)